jgi:hypothetical protein
VVKGRGRWKEDTEKKMVGNWRGVEKRDGGKKEQKVVRKNSGQGEGSGEKKWWEEERKCDEKKW